MEWRCKKVGQGTKESLEEVECQTSDALLVKCVEYKVLNEKVNKIYIGKSNVDHLG